MFRRVAIAAVLVLSVIAEESAVKDKAADGHLYESADAVPVKQEAQQISFSQQRSYGLPAAQSPAQYPSVPSYDVPRPFAQPAAFTPMYNYGFFRKPVEPIITSVCTLDVNFPIIPSYHHGHHDRRVFRAQCAPHTYKSKEDCTKCCQMAAILVPGITPNIVQGMILRFRGRHHCACCAPELALPNPPTPNYAPNQQTQPGYQPNYQPSYQPNYQPSYQPNYQPSYQPNYQPVYQPAQSPSSGY